MELILLHKNIKLKKQRDQYKRERDSLLKDIEFLHQLRKGDCSALDTLKAGNNHLIYERDELNEKLNKECNDNYKLEGQLHDMTKQRDELIKDVEKQRELLKDFSRFIHRKVESCPGKPEYMDFRDRLNELGIGERD